MEFLVNWINDNIETQHPVIVAAIAHYNFVRIHPFDDGNGRGARLLMNLILIKKGISPAVIENEKREDYIYSLRNADIEGPSGFINFVADSLIDTLNVITEDIKKLI